MEAYTDQHSKLEEKDTYNLGNDVEKEEKTPKAKKSKFKSPKQTVIDVEALFKSGDKNSVTNKNLAAMTPEQQTAIIGSVY